MALYEVELGFSMRCVTRGWYIEADSEEEAVRKAEDAVDDHGDVDVDAFAETGGWDTMDGSDHDYDVIEVTGSKE